MSKANIFSFELGMIKSADIREFTRRAIEILPDYFFTIPASSTGKFHPSYVLGEGGLVRHTKALVRIAIELFRNETVQQFSDREKDIIICSCILHDGAKSGIPKSAYTVTEHPTIVVKHILSHKEVVECLDIDTQKEIYKAILSHMGQWNADFKTKKEVLPKPQTEIEKFVHLVDYLASRKCIEINFEVEG